MAKLGWGYKISDVSNKGQSFTITMNKWRKRYEILKFILFNIHIYFGKKRINHGRDR